MTPLGVALVATVMAVGLVGTVVPVMPGLVLIWAAGLVYGLVSGFGTAGIVAFAVMTLLLVAGTVLSYTLPHRAGIQGGAARSSMMLGIVGAVIGMVVIPVLGLPIGAVLGVLLGEFRRLRQWPAAWATTKVVVIGFGKAALAEFLAGVAMIGAWVVWVVAR